MSRIYLAGKYHKDIYYAGKYHKAMYIGTDLVWQKNYFDSGSTDLEAYIQYASHAYRNAVDKSNLIACAVIKPGRTYKVSLFMCTRFRVAAVAAVPANYDVLTNYVYHQLDTNGTAAVNALESLQITAGASDTLLLIGYWTNTGSMAAADIRKTIKVYEVG